MLIRSGSVIALVTAALTAGCFIRGSTTPVGTAEVESANIDRDVYNSPSARYDGRTVYLYNGRWFYRDDTGWKYYAKEPPELYRTRMEKLQQLPPRQAPPAPRYERRPDQTPAPQAAPPPPAPTTTAAPPAKPPMPPGAQPVEPPTPRMPPGAQPVEPPSKPMPPGAQPVEP